MWGQQPVTRVHGAAEPGAAGAVSGDEDQDQCAWECLREAVRELDWREYLGESGHFSSGMGGVPLFWVTLFFLPRLPFPSLILFFLLSFSSIGGLADESKPADVDLEKGVRGEWAEYCRETMQMKTLQHVSEALISAMLQRKDYWE